jgi:hypothetical protein
MRTSLASRLLLTAALLLGAATSIQAQSSCDATSFNGAFGYSLKGYVYDSRGYLYYLGAAGRLVSDGAGNITGADTISYDGSIVRRKFTGTYSVNADCTGTLVLNADDTSITNADFVIVNDGKEVSLVETDANFVLNGELKLQTQTTPPTTTPVAATAAAAK